MSRVDAAPQDVAAGVPRPVLDDTVQMALSQGGLVDVTTTGGRSGQPRRIELVFHAIDGRVIISGLPVAGRKRAWLANLEADPRMTLHLKGRAVRADLPATARVVTDPMERRRLLERVARAWRRSDVDAMVAHGPLIEVVVRGHTPGA